MADPIIYKPFVGDYANAGSDIYIQGAFPTGVFTIMPCAMPGQVTPLTAARSPVLQEMAQMSVGGMEGNQIAIVGTAIVGMSTVG